MHLRLLCAELQICLERVDPVQFYGKYTGPFLIKRLATLLLLSGATILLSCFGKRARRWQGTACWFFVRGIRPFAMAFSFTIVLVKPLQ